MIPIHVRPRRTVAIAVLGLGACFGCNRESPSVSPEPPDVAAPAPAPPALSRFSVPLEFDFTAVLGVVEREVPRKFGSIDSVRVMGTDTRKHYAFEAVRGPFTAFADGNLLHLRATLAYSARGYYKPLVGPTISAGCGNAGQRPRIVVELATPIQLAEDWHLVSHARVVSVKPASDAPRDHCEVSILHKDVTAGVVEAARNGLTGQLGNINKKIAAVDLAGRVTEWWGMLARPIKLADDIWLVLGPERLRVGVVRGRSRVLTVPVSLDARPRVMTGPAEPVVVTSALPPLGKDSASDGFHVILDGIVDFGSASRQLTTALASKTFTESGHSVIVNEVTIRPETHGRVTMAVVFAGDAVGTLRLIGTPRYDHARDVIGVPDLDFDLQSNSTLLQSYKWLKTGALRADLRRRAHFPAAPALARARALLLEGLNRKIGDAVTLSATVDSVAVRGIFITRDGLTIRAEATGRAGVSVKQR